MNFNDIYVGCKSNKRIIDNLQCSRTIKNNVPFYEIKKWKEVYSAINELIKVDSLAPTINTLLSSIPSYYIDKDLFELDNSKYMSFIESFRKLKIEIEQIIKVGDFIGISKDDEFYLNFKLPVCYDFNDYVSYINDIKKVIDQCTYFNSDKEKLIFKNVDIGSSWIIFVISGIALVSGASQLLNNIVAFVDKCIIIHSHYLTLKKQEEDLESAQKDEKTKREILDYIKEEYKKFAKEQLVALESEINVSSKDEEEYDRNIMCCEVLGNLIQKGLEILPSLNNTSENKLLFEPLKMHYISMTETKKIVNNTEE